MTEIKHRSVSANNIRIHLAEMGEGPTVLMIHGFPESWYSWREQLPVLANAGYHAVAMDVRGYGRSSKPTRVEDYRMLQKVADVVGVVQAIDNGKVTIVGHDWGAPIAWNSALLRPDLFTGVAGLSVPYSAGGGAVRPTEMFGRDDQLIVVGRPGDSYYFTTDDEILSPSYYRGNKTQVVILNIADRSKPKEERVVTFDGDVV